MPADLVWWAGVLSWLLIRRLGEVVDRKDPRERVADWLDEWLLGRAIEQQVRELGLGSVEARRVHDTVRLLLAVDGWWATNDEAVEIGHVVSSLVSRKSGRTILGINTWEGVLWYRAEALAELVEWFRLVAVMDTWKDPTAMEGVEDALARLVEAHEVCGCRVGELLDALEER